MCIYRYIQGPTLEQHWLNIWCFMAAVTATLPPPPARPWPGMYQARRTGWTLNSLMEGGGITSDQADTHSLPLQFYTGYRQQVNTHVSKSSLFVLLNGGLIMFDYLGLPMHVVAYVSTFVREVLTVNTP